MSDFTIEQLEALKEGTTPGPWKFREHSDYEYPAGPEWGPMQTELEHAVSDAEGNHLFGAYNNHKMIEHPGNVPLAASAPALVDALIAEKQAHAKLRAEIEGFRRSCIESAESLELNAMTAYSPEACESASIIERDTAAVLTRILEATDD